MRNNDWATALVNLPDGSTVTLRALTAREKDLVDDAFPRPLPPMKKDPTKGSDAPFIPDRADPGYDKQLRRHVKDQQRAHLAIAMDAPDKQGATYTKAEPANRAAWLKEAVDRLADEWLDDVLQMMFERMGELTTVQLVRRAMTIIVEARDPEAKDKADAPKPLEVPENYATTEEGLMLRVCERFGTDPASWPVTLSAEQRATYLANELVRQREESHRDGLLAAALSVVGIRAGG